MGLKFSPVIEFGHVLQAITMAAIGVVFITTRAADLALMKKDLDQQREVQVSLVRELRSVSDTQLEMIAYFRARGNDSFRPSKPPTTNKP